DASSLRRARRALSPARRKRYSKCAMPDARVLDCLEGELYALAARANAAGRCRLTLERVSATMPAAMEEALQKALDRAAERHAPGRHTRMPSGHDAQWLARKLPAAMMFVRSAGSATHWSENTCDADIVLGARSLSMPSPRCCSANGALLPTAAAALRAPGAGWIANPNLFYSARRATRPRPSRGGHFSPPSRGARQGWASISQRVRV